jgi:hypothetical protein
MIAPMTHDSATAHRPERHWGVFWILASLSSAVVIALSLAIEANPAMKLAVRDVAAVARDGLPLPFYTGWISNAGFVGWFASAAALLVCAHVCVLQGRRRAAAYTGGAGVFALLLGADDLFMLHDGAVGTGEEAILLLWLLLGVTWAISFRHELRHDPNLPLVVLAAAMFGHSVIADLATSGVLVVHEDATKLAGIIVWTTWAWVTAARTIALPVVAVVDVTGRAAEVDLAAVPPRVTS